MKKLLSTFLVLTMILPQFSFAAESLDELYGGFVQNRKTKELIAVKCVEQTGEDCTGFKFIYLPSKDSNPSEWKELNPDYVFRDKDIELLQNMIKKKIKYRVQPSGCNPIIIGCNPPIFGATMLVWVLAEQNETGGGKKLPIRALYVLSVPFDLATAIPILVGTTLIWGGKSIVIGVQKQNVKSAIKVLEDKGDLKKISKKNFELMKNLVQQF